MFRTNKGASTNVLQMLLDVFVLLASLGIDYLIVGRNFCLETQLGFLYLTIIFGVVFLLANKSTYLYNVTLFCYTDRLIRKNTCSFLLAAGTVAMMLRFITTIHVARMFYVVFLSIAYVMLVLKVFITKPIMHHLHRQYASRTVFVGDKSKYTMFRSYLEKTSILYEDLGYIAESREIYEAAKEDYIGCVDDLENLIREHHIDQVYVGQDSGENLAETQKYLDLCMDMGVTVKMIIDFYDRRFAKTYVSSVGTYPIITYHTVTLNPFPALVKRIMDLIAGTLGVILTSPIMLITALAIKLESPGPVLFKQTRVGKNGRHFKIYKFRSMYIDAEERKKELLSQNEIKGGIMFKIKNDPRITRVGKVIRKLSIDELPQFFNVLGGSMSLVGTRPPTLDEVEKYKTNQWRRISIKPGITGMWQVSGRSNIDDFEDIVKLDVEYIDNWSIWLDIKILFKTVLVVLQHKDAC